MAHSEADPMTIAILVPCYNEAATIEKVIRDFQREIPEAAIYVFDNNSADGNADTLVALGVAVCLMGISLHIFREVYKQFMDEALPEEEIKQLGSIIDRFSEQFVEVHGLRTRQSGAERHIEMHLVVMPETSVSTAHALSHEIEDAITGAWPTTRVIVHIEPLDTDRAARTDWFTDQPKVRTNDASPDEREFMH